MKFAQKQREAKELRARAAKKRKERNLMRMRKRELETLPQLKKKAQAAFNAFIRKRDAGKTCISCNAFLTDKANSFDAGHYRSVGAAPHLRFNELNCHGQCKHCNNYLSGNHINYRIGLIQRIGLVGVETVECDNEPKHYSKDDLRAIEKLYKEKRKKYDEI